MPQATNARAGAVAEAILRWFAWLCLLELVATWIVIAFLGDRVWWSVIFLFGPRWVLSLPWFGMVPWLLANPRRAILPALAGVIVVVFGLLDFHLGLHRAAVGSGVPFKVLEFNADGGHGPLADQTLALIQAEAPDLVVIAECGPELAAAFKALPGYQSQAGNPPGLCLVSRGAILSWQARDQTDVFHQGGAGYIVRAVVSTAAGPVRVGLVHLATPRHALDSYFSLHNIPLQGPQTWVNINQREEESHYAHDWIAQGPALPTIIAGDFNLTVESSIYGRYWGDFRNAFGRAGWGTGYTKHTRRWGVRIDHILTSDDIGTHSAHVGRNIGSDHWPMIAELVLPAQRTSTAR